MILHIEKLSGSCVSRNMTQLMAHSLLGRSSDSDNLAQDVDPADECDRVPSKRWLAFVNKRAIRRFTMKRSVAC